MPKKPDTKIVKQGKVDIEEIPLIKEKPRVIFRLFECLVHLEQAREHLLKVGIFCGDSKEQEITNQKLNLVLFESDRLLETYKKLWAEMQQKGS